jgi:exonuclease SbcD
MLRRVDHLVARAYDYWALGHTHERRDLSRDGVHIEFPGNLQGRSMRETGAKGCSVVTVADDHKVTSRFEALDVVRWQELTVEGEDHDIERIVRQALERLYRITPDDSSRFACTSPVRLPAARHSETGWMQ